jgi:SAM-dependent methyltransferase
MLPENKFDIQTKKQLTAADFDVLFNDHLSEFMQKRLELHPLWYRELSLEEYNRCLLTMVQAILNPKIVTAGEHRLDDWEKGWSENYTELTNLLFHGDVQIDSIVPRYFGKHEFVRLHKAIVKPLSENFEYYALCMIVDWLFDQYMRDAESIYEFGCGTGYHLMRLRGINPSAALYGLDWAPASQKIISLLVDNKYASNIYGQRFDYYNPDTTFRLNKNAIVYTVASLEQVGNHHNKFVDYLLDNRPSLCIHIEPISELLDNDSLLDYLSIAYFKKRNYLSGFLTRLLELEKLGKIRILKKLRTHVGSLFIEGHSVIVWAPI